MPAAPASIIILVSFITWFGFGLGLGLGFGLGLGLGFGLGLDRGGFHHRSQAAVAGVAVRDDRRLARGAVVAG